MSLPHSNKVLGSAPGQTEGRSLWSLHVCIVFLSILELPSSVDWKL